jgi:hypothetical protein
MLFLDCLSSTISLWHFCEPDSSIILVDAIIGKTQIHRHSGVIPGPFLHLQKALPHIRKGALQLALQIASNYHSDVVLLNYVENVVLLINLRKLPEFVAGKVHQKLHLILGAFVVLDGKSVERGVLYSQMKAVEQTPFEGEGSFLVPG